MLPVNPATPQAKKLYRALKEKDVKCILEFYDEHKHVDICIPDAKIYIEIDGDAHFFDHRQIKADALRDSWSEKGGYKTFRFSNEFIDAHLDGVVNGIMKVSEKRKSENMDVYNFPKYYEIGFSFRDVPAEADFMEELIRRYSKIPVKTVLELASGNSPHIAELCNRGYSYIGLELNEAMVDYARVKAGRFKTRAGIIKGDMLRFSLPVAVDCVLVFMGSFYIKNDEELKTHLSSVSGVLRSGGIYLLDGVVSYFPGDLRRQDWEESKDGVTVGVSYIPRWLDKESGLLEGRIVLRVKDGGKTRKIEHVEVRKIYSFDEFVDALKKSKEWEYIDSFSDFDIKSKPRKGGRNITVIRKK